jgi:hypothetical protein
VPGTINFYDSSLVFQSFKAATRIWEENRGTCVSSGSVAACDRIRASKSEQQAYSVIYVSEMCDMPMDKIIVRVLTK